MKMDNTAFILSAFTKGRTLHILAGNSSYPHMPFEHAEIHSTHVKRETCS